MDEPIDQDQLSALADYHEGEIPRSAAVNRMRERIEQLEAQLRAADEYAAALLARVRKLERLTAECRAEQQRALEGLSSVHERYFREEAQRGNE